MSIITLTPFLLDFDLFLKLIGYYFVLMFSLFSLEVHSMVFLSVFPAAEKTLLANFFRGLSKDLCSSTLGPLSPRIKKDWTYFLVMTADKGL